jgi:hypothetical protein
MIVWGGGGFVSGVYFNTGGRYDPATSGWTATSTGANVPTARTFHSAVWTGSEMIVWGGNGSAVPFNTGGRYCAASSCSVSTWYRDADADGYGSSSDVVLSCDQPPGYAPAGGDCNESNGNVHPGALELCNLIDDNCDGTIDNAAQPAGSSHVSASHAAGGALISWTSVSGATGYDLVRGSLTVLASSGGNFTLATDACLQDNSPLTIRSDPGAPAPGQGKWYLVRGQNCGGAGTYDSGAPSQVGSRDAEIAAASGACP